MVRRFLAGILLIAATALPALAQYPPGPPPPVPALPDAARQTSYTLTAQTCACAVGFQLYGDSTDYQNWVEVWLNGVKVAYNDAAHGWSLSSPTGSFSTIPRPITDAILTFNAAQTGTVIIVGARRPRRIAEFSENQGVPARALNQTFNDLYGIDRETWDKINDFSGRGLFFPPGNATGPMPSPASCANQLLGFDNTGLNPQCHGMISANGNVVGASPTVNGNLAQWTNTSGTAADDSGISAAVLAGEHCNVKAKGALGNGVADDTAAISACVSALSTTGGTIFFPASSGVYCTFSGIAINQALQINFVGAGENVSVLDTCHHDVTVLSMTTPGSTEGAHSIIGMGINGDNDPATTHPAVLLDSFCVGCLVDRSLIQYGTFPLLLKAPDIYVRATKALNGYSGVVQLNGAGVWFTRDKFDQSWPHALVGTIAAWQAGTSYVVGNVVTNNGMKLQETVSSCTSAGSAPTNRPYGSSISDNTCSWFLVGGATNYFGMSVVGVSESALDQVDITGSFDVALNIDSGANPTNFKINKSIFGGGLGANINLATGNEFTISNSEIGGCVNSNCSAMAIQSGWTGHTTISGNLFSGGAINLYVGGGIDLTVTGNSIHSSTADGIAVAAGVTKFAIVGNTIDASSGASIVVAVGASDFYNIIGNMVAGTAVTDGGTGTHKTLSGNN